MKRCGSASPACVLPLGFTGQGVILAGALAEAIAKFNRIQPAHLLHRTIVTLEARGIGLQVKIDFWPTRNLPPLGLGDRCLGHEERAQGHLVLGAFTLQTLRLVLR